MKSGSSTMNRLLTESKIDDMLPYLKSVSIDFKKGFYDLASHELNILTRAIKQFKYRYSGITGKSAERALWDSIRDKVRKNPKLLTEAKESQVNPQLQGKVIKTAGKWTLEQAKTNRGYELVVSDGTITEWIGIYEDGSWYVSEGSGYFPASIKNWLNSNGSKLKEFRNGKLLKEGAEDPEDGMGSSIGAGSASGEETGMTVNWLLGVIDDAIKAKSSELGIDPESEEFEETAESLLNGLKDVLGSEDDEDDED